MAGPFDFMSGMLQGPGAPAAPPTPATDPRLAPLSQTTNPFARMFGLGTTPEAQEEARKQAGIIQEQRDFGLLAQKAAQISARSPGMDQGRLIMELMQDPEASNLIMALPAERIKDLPNLILPKPDFIRAGQGETIAAVPAGTPFPTPVLQGTWDQKFTNPIGQDRGTRQMPAQVLPGGQPPLGANLPPDPDQPMNLAPPQPQMPAGMSLTQPTAMAAPAAAPAAGTQRGKYDLTIEAEGTALRGNPYDEVFGYGQWGKSDKPLTQMTLAEVRDFGNRMRIAQANAGIPWGQTSSAAGAFQILATSTMGDAQDALGLPDSTIFTPQVQQQMHDWVLENQGVGAWEGFKNRPDLAAQMPGAPATADAYAQSASAPVGPPVDRTVRLIDDMPPEVTLDALTGVVEGDRSLMHLGTGLGPFLARTVGTTGRQFSPGSKPESQALFASRAQAMKNQVQHAVLTARKGREDAGEKNALLALLPGTGLFSDDPLSSIEEALALDNYAQLQVRTAQKIIENPASTDQGIVDAETNKYNWLNVQHTLGPREDMLALRDKLIKDPSSLKQMITPSHLASSLTSEVPSETARLAGEYVNQQLTRQVPKSMQGTLTPDRVKAASDADVQAWALQTNNDEKKALSPEVMRAIIARLKRSKTVQPQGQ